MLTLRQKMILPPVLALLLLGLLTYLLAERSFSTVLAGEVRAHHEDHVRAIRREVELLAGAAQRTARVLAALPEVRAALERAAGGDLDDPRDPLVQQAREALRRELRALDLAHRTLAGAPPLRFHVHLPGARSFLRLWRRRQALRDGRWIDISDELASFRHTVLAVQRSGKPVKGVELGRGGFTVRGLVPVAGEGGRLLGSAEVLLPLARVFDPTLDQPGWRHALLMNDEELAVTTALRDPRRYPRVRGRRHGYVVALLAGARPAGGGALPPELALPGLIDAGRQGVTHAWAEPGASSYFVTAFPVRDFRQRQIGVVLLASDQSAMLAAGRRFRLSLAGVTAGVVLLLAGVLLLLGRRAVRPILETNQRLAAIAESEADLDSRLRPGGRDEVGELASQFNRFMARLQQSFADLAHNTGRILQLVSPDPHRPQPPAPGDGERPPAAESPPLAHLTLAQATRQTDEILRRVRRAILLWQRSEQHRALLASLVTASPDAILATDREARVLSCNPGAEALYGRAAAEVEGRSVLELIPDQLGEERQQVAGAIARGEALGPLETERRRADGARFFVSLSVSPIRDDAGQTIGAAVVEHDTSKRRQAEAEAEAQRQQLVQADKLATLGTLVAGVAHEISNPNSFIMLNAPTVRELWEAALPYLDELEGQEPGSVQLGAMPYAACRDWVPTLLRDIEKGSERIRRIVASLKDYARKAPAELSEGVQLNEAVQGAMTLTQSCVKKVPGGVALALSPELPPLRANKQRLEQVVINLLINACDATAEGGGVRVRTAPAPGGGVLLEVSDTGRGIPAELLGRVVDPFFTTKRGQGGTGLGLSITAGIVEEHGGTLELRSTPGEGTTARVTLPAEESA